MKLSRMVGLCFISVFSPFVAAQAEPKTLDFEDTEYARNFLFPISPAMFDNIAEPTQNRTNFVLQNEEFAPLENARLSNALDSIFENDTDSNTVWSVDVRAFSPSGQSYTVYQLNPQTLVRPASTMKVLTTWAAFHNVPELLNTSSRQYDQVYEMMKTSDNDIAETVLNWVGGPQAIWDTFKQENLGHSANMKIIDGSGLSYSNRLSSSDLIQVLLSLRYSQYYKKFHALLPIAGVDGTLAYRPITKHANVSAKTGTLIDNPSVALSGYADVSGGWQVVFSILGDSIPDVDGGRSTIDKAVDEISNTMSFYK